MLIKKKICCGIAVFAIGVLGLVPINSVKINAIDCPTKVGASLDPTVCTYPKITHSGVSQVVIGDPKTRVLGIPGTEISVQKGSTVSLSTTYSVTAGVSVSDVLSTLSTTVGVSLSKSHSYSVNFTRSYKVPSGGGNKWVEAGVVGYKSTFKQQNISYQTGKVISAITGTVTAVTTSPACTHN